MAMVGGQVVKVGDYVCFKCDIEQGAEITKIITDSRGRAKLYFKAPPDGFSGEYIGDSDTHSELATDCWL